MRVEVTYCDHCGDMVYVSNNGTVKQHKEYTSLPWNVNSANKGESGTICFQCIKEFKEGAQR